jgi:hypothetical protein
MPSPSRRWLLFVHQLPSQPSNLRVSTWRRLQQIGAIALKQAVYALPDTPAAREDFEWLRTEVKAAGGDASVFAADNLDDGTDDALIEEFRRSRQIAYEELAGDAEAALTRAGGRRPRGRRSPAVRRLLDIFRARLAAIDAIDFFGSPGRDRVIALLEQLEDHMPTARSPQTPSSRVLAEYQARLWVTRPRPGVDRMASAWLIRRFIDPRARFAFAADRNAVPEHGVAFDMFGVDFSHQGDGCTFETLCAVFGIRAPALSRLAAIVHDLDLKDGRFGAPECSTVSALIEGLQLAHQDDEVLLGHGMTLFESLYRSFEHSVRRPDGRSVAQRKAKATAPRKKRKKRRTRQTR